ncbi:methyltransferase domain-containing protein [Neiella marina]|uniref:Methyltransferase domain-containing protein n=1 Tax=Neiella holothuriorum TaxID=2870530 RepID=A0ABS7EDI2_9GAMM|nr:methyltransferase domain-containing protein [Neiella holothuriorum]MBW8190398.1 methyltransferase domain-containing protein [Neiella holothuriorum]
MSDVRICYQTICVGQHDIHIRSLRDNQQFADPLGEAESFGISSAQWPLFGVLWTSSEVLAHQMVDFEIEGKRILEVGCGLALSSLLLKARQADVTATDIHPEAERFLVENIRLNGTSNIPFLRTGWADTSDGLGQFDVIIGSDLLYEIEQAELLSQFIQRHAKPNSEVIMIDPGRKIHPKFSKKMGLLGYQLQKYKPPQTDYETGTFSGQILRYRREA